MADSSVGPVACRSLRTASGPRLERAIITARPWVVRQVPAVCGEKFSSTPQLASPKRCTLLLTHCYDDRAAVGRVENALDRIFQAPTTRQVIFDLRRLTFLDAAGLGTILKADQRARARSFDLVVVRPRGHANRIFTLTRAGKELSMVDEPGVVA